MPRREAASAEESKRSGPGGSRKAAKKSAQRCMQPLVAAERPVRACKLFPPKRRSLKQAKGGAGGGRGRSSARRSKPSPRR